MIVVLIHWKIKPDKIEEFKTWWTSKEANVEERAGLTGEFLSEPLPLEELSKNMPADHQPFQVCDLIPSPGDDPYTSFVNVGLWQNWDEFYRQVGKNFNDTKPKKDFEQYRRTRTILNPLNWRIGKWQLPSSDNLD